MRTCLCLFALFISSVCGQNYIAIGKSGGGKSTLVHFLSTQDVQYSPLNSTKTYEYENEVYVDTPAFFFTKNDNTSIHTADNVLQLQPSVFNSSTTPSSFILNIAGKSNAEEEDLMRQLFTLLRHQPNNGDEEEENPSGIVTVLHSYANCEKLKIPYYRLRLNAPVNTDFVCVASRDINPTLFASQMQNVINVLETRLGDPAAASSKELHSHYTKVLQECKNEVGGSSEARFKLVKLDQYHEIEKERKAVEFLKNFASVANVSEIKEMTLNLKNRGFALTNVTTTSTTVINGTRVSSSSHHDELMKLISATHESLVKDSTKYLKRLRNVKAVKKLRECGFYNVFDYAVDSSLFLTRSTTNTKVLDTSLRIVTSSNTKPDKHDTSTTTSSSSTIPYYCHTAAAIVLVLSAFLFF